MTPDRIRFRSVGIKVRFGLVTTSATNHLFEQFGVYMIAHEGRVIYVGRACGKETVGSRLGKHRIKLTGSSSPGVHHPKRWRQYVAQRYHKSPDLVCRDRLDGFAFSYFPTSRQSDGFDRGALKELESSVYNCVTELQRAPPCLNDERRISNQRSVTLIEVKVPVCVGAMTPPDDIAEDSTTSYRVPGSAHPPSVGEMGKDHYCSASHIGIIRLNARRSPVVVPSIRFMA